MREKSLRFAELAQVESTVCFQRKLSSERLFLTAIDSRSADLACEAHRASHLSQITL
ncbi:hypothetical protein [Gardnerella sp. DNF00536]|uniref:hypothetical protein n=1 Tax=Gardnerella sp. DNF00536 TaxID=2749050 RepID=UPI003BB12057